MAQMTQDEIDQRIAEMGGEKLEHSNAVGKKRVKNPAYDPNDLRGNQQQYIDGDIEQWKSPDGAILQAIHMPDGSWEIVKDTPGTKPAGATRKEGDTRGPQTGPTREVWRGGQWVSEPNPQYREPGTPRIEGTPLPGGGFDNEHPVMVTRDSKGNIVGQPRELTPGEMKEWRESRERSRNPGGKTDAEVQAQQPASTRKPIERNGKTYTEVTTVNPTTKQTETHYEDASGNRVELPADVKSSSTDVVVNGQHYTKVTKPNPDGTVEVTYLGPDGKPVASLPTDNKESPYPADAPVYTPDPDDPAGDFGLTAYNQQLIQANAQGRLTREQVTKLLSDAIGSATVAESSYNNQQTRLSNQRGQDITQRQQDLGEVQSRRSAANDVFKDAYGRMVGTAQMLGEGGGGLAAKAFTSAILGARDNAQEWGGMAEVPQIPQAIQATRKIKLGKDGSVHIEIPDPTPSTPLTPADQAAQQAAAGGTPPAVQGTPSQVGDTGAPPVPARSSPVAAAQKPAAAPNPSMVPGTPSVVGDTGAPAVPPTGNERPDDILTVINPSGAQEYIQRSDWDAAGAQRQQGYTVLNAENGPLFRQRNGWAPAAPGPSPAAEPPTGESPYGGANRVLPAPSPAQPTTYGGSGDVPSGVMPVIEGTRAAVPVFTPDFEAARRAGHSQEDLEQAWRELQAEGMA